MITTSTLGLVPGMSRAHGSPAQSEKGQEAAGLEPFATPVSSGAALFRMPLTRKRLHEIVTPRKLTGIKRTR